MAASVASAITSRVRIVFVIRVSFDGFGGVTLRSCASIVTKIAVQANQQQRLGCGWSPLRTAFRLGPLPRRESAHRPTNPSVPLCGAQSWIGGTYAGLSALLPQRCPPLR